LHDSEQNHEEGEGEGEGEGEDEDEDEDGDGDGGEGEDEDEDEEGDALTGERPPFVLRRLIFLPKDPLHPFFLPKHPKHLRCSMTNSWNKRGESLWFFSARN
jgi:hypothetical protein